jgi:hypothetical protein
MGAFERLLQSLARRRVRFVVIGLSGANYYARSAGGLFATQDRDLFLKPEPRNVLAAWQGCEAAGLQLYSGDEPLDMPRDVVANRALVRATDGAGLDVDLTLVMSGFDFATVWRRRRIFRVEGTEVPVARLTDIVESKRVAGRDKDRLFFAAHADAIRGLLASADAPTAREPKARRRRRSLKTHRP